jgi:hypothetical protein
VLCSTDDALDNTHDSRSACRLTPSASCTWHAVEATCSQPAANSCANNCSSPLQSIQLLEAVFRTRAYIRSMHCTADGLLEELHSLVQEELKV